MSVTRTIRFRMTLWYAALLLAGFAVFGVLLYGNLRRQLYADLDSHLRAQAQAVVSYIADHPTAPDLDDLRKELREYATPRTLPMLIEVRHGKYRVMRSTNMSEDERLPLPSAGIRSLRFRGSPHRCYAADTHGYTVVVASPEEAERRMLRQLSLTLALFAPLVALFATGGGWFLAGRLLQPVDTLTRRAQHIGAEDLTQRLEVPGAEDELARLAQTLNAMLERIDTAFAQQRQFTADASHELRTPLTAMRSEVEVMLRQRRSAEEYERTLASLLSDIAHLTKIVNDLFTLSQADASPDSSGLLEQSTVRLDELARDVAERYQPLAENKGVSITCETEPITLTADASRLRQLLFNLIDNAIKYTPSGGGVSVTCHESGVRSNPSSLIPHLVSTICLTVSDTGIGIPPEHLPHIFERFYRVDKARSREQGGSGLGLSICRWIAEAHGGDISVESEVGKGSTFSVYIPAED